MLQCDVLHGKVQIKLQGAINLKSGSNRYSWKLFSPWIWTYEYLRSNDITMSQL